MKECRQQCLGLVAHSANLEEAFQAFTPPPQPLSHTGDFLSCGNRDRDGKGRTINKYFPLWYCSYLANNVLRAWSALH